MAIASRGRTMRVSPLLSLTNDYIGTQGISVTPLLLGCPPIPDRNWHFESLTTLPTQVDCTPCSPPDGSDSDDEEDKKKSTSKKDKKVKFKSVPVDEEVEIPSRSAFQKCFNFIQVIVRSHTQR